MFVGSFKGTVVAKEGAGASLAMRVTEPLTMTEIQIKT